MNAEEIKNMYTMRDILERYDMPQPNRAGFIRCPFHKGDRQASLKVYERDFHCFACGANGDIFTFVMLMDGLTFKEAFRALGGSYDTSFPAQLKIYRAQKAREMNRKKQDILKKKRQLNNSLISFYRKYLNLSEPLSETWCDCYNGLQYQIYLNELLNDPEECYGVIEQIKQRNSPRG